MGYHGDHSPRLLSGLDGIGPDEREIGWPYSAPWWCCSSDCRHGDRGFASGSYRCIGFGSWTGNHVGSDGETEYKLTGTQKRGDSTDKVAGVRAPALQRPMPKAWSKPEPLFNGKDLDGLGASEQSRQ